MSYRLVSINLSGTMQGPIFWPVGEVCETEFDVDFAAPGPRIRHVLLRIDPEPDEIDPLSLF